MSDSETMKFLCYWLIWYSVTLGSAQSLHQYMVYLIFMILALFRTFYSEEATYRKASFWPAAHTSCLSKKSE